MVSKDYVADCFIWKENIDGNYTTTYGYKWLLDKRITPNHQQSSRRWIWKLKAYEINKILHLVCLPPIYSSLIYLCFTRETCPNMFVVRCLLFEETIFHCLRDCSTFKKSMAWSWLHEYQLFFSFQIWISRIGFELTLLALLCVCSYSSFGGIGELVILFVWERKQSFCFKF